MHREINPGRGGAVVIQGDKKGEDQEDPVFWKLITDVNFHGRGPPPKSSRNSRSRDASFAPTRARFQEMGLK